MATTINIVNALYKEAISDVTKDAEHWQSFLKTASMNYTNEFDEQLLIYYQRPEAVACATINDWNNKFKRLVNEGCPGIGLKTYYGTKPGIKYVWGLNDTHNMYNSRNNLKLWQIPKQYEENVILLLEEKFGTINNKSNFASSIKDLAFNLVDDNIFDYLEDLVNNKENTLLESISNDTIENKYRELAVNSIAYMIINRSGVDPTPYFDNIDFENISMFQDLSSLARIGAFISNTSKTGLSEMYLAIKNVQIAEKNKIRTFANKNNIVYDVGENERRDAYESNLREERRLSNSEYISRGGGNSHDEQIRSNVASTLERKQEWDLSRNEDDRNSNEELKRNRSNISSEGITDNQAIDIREQHNGRNESNRPDEVGRSYEQYQSDSRRNDNERVDLQLEEYIKDNDTYSPYVVVDEKVNQIITKAPNLKDININIAKYFKETDNKEERASYIKSLFKVNANDIEIDGIIYNLKSFKNGVLFWKEDFDTRDTELFITYEELVNHYDAMILLKQIDIDNNLYEQNTLFDNEESKVENRPDIQITYEFVDKYLQSENKEFKFQIYKQFTAMNSKQDDIEYIKNRYGLSGSSYTIRGAGIGYSADTKGIEFNRGYLAPSTVKQFFTWSNIADRISKLIREGNYLTPDEEKEYQQWLSIEDKKDEFIVETITPINELDDERAFTVARVMNYDYCVELHYSKGKANVEVMTRTSPDSWHGIVEDIDWFTKDLTDKYVLNKLEDIFYDNFPDVVKSDINNYYGEYNDEIDLIDHILHKHKIDDIRLSFDDDSNLVAKDDDNVWYGKEFYDFLFDELFVYNEDDEVDLIDKEDLERLKEYRKKYDINKADIPTEKEIENSEINQVSQLSLFDEVEQKINDDGILGYHAFQSFKEGEVSADVAHLIGLKLAEELWGDRFEVIVSTHINTDNIHNHFVINSVSFKDGKKYHDCNESYALLRHTSDDLCQEYGLSVVDKDKMKKGKVNYDNYYNGYIQKNNYHTVAKQDLDRAIAMAYSYNDFENIMIKMGYEVNNRYGKLSIRREPYKKNIRIERAFGSDYSIETIEKRIESEIATRVPFIEAYNPNNAIKSYKKAKIQKREHGIYGLYKYYCYILNVYPKHYPKRILNPILRIEAQRMDKISQETRLLVSNKIETYEEFSFYKDSLNNEVDNLISKRHNLWIKYKRTKTEEDKIKIRNEIDSISRILNVKRKEANLCDDIENRLDSVRQNIQDFENEKGKEKEKDEFK